MDFTNFQWVLNWVIANGYFIVFISMLIDGPIITAAAAFAAALGYFDIGIIFLISILGDVIADIIYYLIGYWGRLALAERYGRYFGLSNERIHKIEKLFNEHAIKTLIVLKLTPIFSTTGLILVGATKMPWGKYTLISFLMTLPKSVLFLIIGYYFGYSYDTIVKQLHNDIAILLVIVVLLVVIYYLFKKVSVLIAKRITEI